MTDRNHERFLSGGGELGALVRAMDWSQTPIGAVNSWSPALRMMVRLLLANRFPLLLWWGSEYVSIYNDAYRPVLGDKHPWALGKPVRECWSEIWHILRPLIDTPFSGGPATWNEDILLEIKRHGFLEETHFTIAYSPVPDDTVPSGIGGVLATVHEITEKVVGERRVVALRDLGARVGDAKTAEEACEIAARTLAPHDKDIPFALLYLVDSDGTHARLAGTAGVERGSETSPVTIDLDGAGGGVWPLREVMQSHRMQLVERLSERFRMVPCGPWADPPDTAVVVPIPSNMPHQPAGMMVAGVSARLKLDEYYRDFFELVAARTATAIANARAYEEERKRAEALAEIDRAKTAFFSNVSHEFRTPLTLMLGPLEDILGRPDVGTVADSLTVVHRNGLRLLKLVNTLLDFSRIEAGRIEAMYEPTELGALTAELASNFRSACERAGLRLVVDCAPLRQPVYVDRDMWEKIVLNLLSNAFKFTFDGEIRVALRSEGDRVLLEVSDTGTGIPAEEIPHLFERFYRIKGARARTYEGTGIGLTLVQELARLHGGSVSVESAFGRGSTFCVAIPSGTVHVPAARIGVSRAVASTAVGPGPFVAESLRWLPDDGRRDRDDSPGEALVARQTRAADARIATPPRILWADDNADMREYVSRLLGEHWAVEAVPDGKTALEAARAHLPDLVLADVMMPGLDGFALLRALREHADTANIPVVLLSARAGEEARVEGMRAGADDYIIKPFTARELIARVGTHLALSRARREATQEALAARAEAESANRAKDIFFATLSHELRQPMASMVGWIRMLQKSELPADARRQGLETLERSVQTLTRLIDDMLDVSSIVMGKLQLRFQAVDLRKPVAAAVEVIRPAATAKGVTIHLQLEPGAGPTILGDPDRLQQTVWNLLSNAVKFTPEGGRVSVHLRQTAEGVTLSVTDTGRGITPEFLPRIFERFSQAPSATGTGSGGLGLGLAIARHLVEMHGGTIVVASEGEGRGSTFTITFPGLSK